MEMKGCLKETIEVEYITIFSMRVDGKEGKGLKTIQTVETQSLEG